MSTGVSIRPLVYQITNLVNGKFYIGVTKSGLQQRKLQHLRAARGRKQNFPIYLAIRKYGEDAFAFTALCECETYEEALVREIELIAEMRPPYNATDGGQGLCYWTGKVRDAETNRKISITKTGVSRGHTPPHALEIFKENMRRAARARRKKVRCINDGLIFDSAREASKHYGFHSTTVAAVANKSRQAVYGLRFEYA